MTEIMNSTVEVENEKIQVFRPDWAQIADGLLLIDLHIGYWRALTNLNLEDLGLEKAPEAYKELIRENINLGSKRLLPKKLYCELTGLEVATRELLYKNSFKSPWGYLLPKKNYFSWKERMKSIREKFFEIRDTISSDRNSIIEKMRVDYEKTARYAYLVSTGTSLVDENAYVPEEFISNFVTSIISKIPSSDEINDSFRFEWVPSYLATPVELENERVEAEKTRENWKSTKEVASEERKLELDSKRLDLEIKQKTMDSKLSKVDQTMDIIAISLRKTLYDIVTDALEATKKNDVMKGGTVKSLRVMINRIRSLNFSDDEDIEGYLQKIESLVGSKNSSEDRSIQEIQSTLKEIGIITRGELLALGDNPRNRKDLEIPEEINLEIMRRAKITLFGEENLETVSLQRNQRTI